MSSHSGKCVSSWEYLSYYCQRAASALKCKGMRSRSSRIRRRRQLVCMCPVLPWIPVTIHSCYLLEKQQKAWLRSYRDFPSAAFSASANGAAFLWHQPWLLAAAGSTTEAKWMITYLADFSSCGLQNALWDALGFLQISGHNFGMVPPSEGMSFNSIPSLCLVFHCFSPWKWLVWIRNWPKKTGLF